MAYRALPKFDPSATFLATARLPVYNGIPFRPGEALPPLPDDPGPRRAYVQDLRQMFDQRKVQQVEPSANPKSTNRKEKAHGRAKG